MNYNQPYYPDYSMQYQYDNAIDMYEDKSNFDSRSVMIMMFFVFICCCSCVCFLLFYTAYYLDKNNNSSNTFSNNSNQSQIIYDNNNKPILLTLVTDNGKYIYISFYSNKEDLGKAVIDKNIDIVCSIFNEDTEFYPNANTINNGSTIYKILNYPKNAMFNEKENNLKNYINSLFNDILDNSKKLNKNVLLQNNNCSQFAELFSIMMIIFYKFPSYTPENIKFFMDNYFIKVANTYSKDDFQKKTISNIQIEQIKNILNNVKSFI